MNDDVSAREPRSPPWRGVWRAWCGAAVIFVVAGCGGDGSVDPAADRGAARASATETTLPETTTTGSAPDSALSVASTWHWQLQGDLDTTVDADVYDIDLFDTPPALVAELRSASRIVICYFSAGSYEEWRPDAAGFAPSDLGDTLDGFEDERWLDVRSDTVRAVVEGRLDDAVALGCDGVEPDNVDGYLNDSGFDIAPADQLAFNRFVANAAHARGLLVGLKNDLDQIPELVDSFDFAVNEQCHEFDECELNRPFIDAGKPAFNAEYASPFVDDPDLVCPASLALDLRTLILPLDLGGSFRISCDDR